MGASASQMNHRKDYWGKYCSWDFQRALAKRRKLLAGEDREAFPKYCDFSGARRRSNLRWCVYCGKFGGPRKVADWASINVPTCRSCQNKVRAIDKILSECADIIKLAKGAIHDRRATEITDTADSRYFERLQSIINTYASTTLRRKYSSAKSSRDFSWRSST